MPYFSIIMRRTVFLIIVLLPWTAAGQGPDSISEAVLAAHNAVRSKLNLPDLTWSEELAAHAREWALHLAEDNDCRLEHRPRIGQYARAYGENLYWVSPIRYGDGTRKVQQVDAADVVAGWAAEAKNFDYRENRCREKQTCGHYTQVVWRSTEQVGCGRAVCRDKSQVWVCNYYPAGNIIGQRPY